MLLQHRGEDERSNKWGMRKPGISCLSGDLLPIAIVSGYSIGVILLTIGRGKKVRRFGVHAARVVCVKTKCYYIRRLGLDKIQFQVQFVEPGVAQTVHKPQKTAGELKTLWSLRCSGAWEFLNSNLQEFEVWGV